VGRISKSLLDEVLLIFRGQNGEAMRVGLLKLCFVAGPPLFHELMHTQKRSTRCRPVREIICTHCDIRISLYLESISKIS
jgi:hypothetical protein